MSNGPASLSWLAWLSSFGRRGGRGQTSQLDEAAPDGAGVRNPVTLARLSKLGLATLGQIAHGNAKSYLWITRGI